jgi:SAM-dependent methyltransferase
MKTEEKKSYFLNRLFKHLDGIAISPILMTLEKEGLLSHILKNDTNSLRELANQHNANIGYLNVALRMLASQGHLNQKIDNKGVDIQFKSKLSLQRILGWHEHYNIVSALYDTNIDYSILFKNSDVLESALFSTLENYIKYREEIPYSHAEPTMVTHIEGAVLGPIIVSLARANCFENIKNKDVKWWKNINQDWQEIIKKLFNYSNLTDENNQITEYGYFILKRATSYGVTVSYLPTFRNIKNLIFGNHKILWNQPGEVEKHVDRSMNVWGSGGAHHTYFKKIDEIIIDLFNLPIEKQPKGFIDIGCGNGKLIEHIFDLIYYKTERGKQLEKHPLFIVGSDFNYKALEATKETITKADIWAKTAFGDISDPKSLAKRLDEKHQIKLEDLLNVRSFLDHNRIYTPAAQKIKRISKSTAAFCHKGQRIDNNALQQNLKEHFEKWQPYLKKYGLLIVELHTIDPKLAAQSLGKNAITAYDASHGFSDQYIIEYKCFLEAALDAGLKPDPAHEHLFPSKETPIVSINRLIDSTD